MNRKKTLLFIKLLRGSTEEEIRELRDKLNDYLRE